jgi:DNA replication protein DnaC
MEHINDVQDVASIDKMVEELIAKGPPKAKPQQDTSRCELCGGAYGGPVGIADFFCRCRVARIKANEVLDSIDPNNQLTLDTYHPRTETQRQALESAKCFIGGTGAKQGFAIFGRPGLGKTHLAIGTCREVLDRDGVFGYYNVVSLISRIQESYSGEGYDSRTSIIEEVAKRNVVVLDDLGKEHRSANVDSIIYELVDTLYAKNRSLIVCSNLPSSEYKERYDEAVRSRLAGMCEILVIEGEDMRRAS